MTPGQLVKAVSIAINVPEETVVQHDRNLAVAGLRTMGARGVNAPPVTVMGAARLYVATLASYRTKDSVETVQSFERAKFQPSRSREEALAALEYVGASLPRIPEENFLDPAINGLPPKHNFVEAIAALIEAAIPLSSYEADFARFNPLIIRCSSPILEGRIGPRWDWWGGATYRDGPFPSVRDVWEKHQGIKQTRQTTGVTIMLMGKAFRDDGLPFENTERAFRGLFDEAKARAKKKVV